MAEIRQLELIHHETVDDAYLPNADKNQRTSPAYSYQSRIKSSPRSSSITIVQVNVNAIGRNYLLRITDPNGKTLIKRILRE